MPNCSVRSSPFFDPTCVGCAFDPIEEGFSRAVGRLWSSFAATGDPNARRRGRGTSGGASTEEGGSAGSASQGGGGSDEWPRVSGTSDVNVVLEPERAAVSPLSQRMRSEEAMGRSARCELWDEIDASGASAAGREEGGWRQVVRHALEAAGLTSAPTGVGREGALG